MKQGIYNANEANAANTGPSLEPSAMAESGWPSQPNERRDFLHRVRMYPPTVASWRHTFFNKNSAALAKISSAGLDEKDEIPTTARLDAGITCLREVASLLALLYGTPRLGNHDDPVDELVYIILSRKTREEAYQAAFKRLKARFRTWDALLASPDGEVERFVDGGGLVTKKAHSLISALGILRDRFGSCTLEPARAWTDSQLEELFRSMPEVGPKSALCIMMYSFGRQVFPVDTHVGRVLTRLGPYKELGVELEGLDHKQLQAVLTDLIPPNLRYSLHVNLIAHGREVCKAEDPLCDQCEVNFLCKAYREARLKAARETKSPTIVDLFAGAGGSSEGFTNAGFKVVLAVDKDESAMKTYRLNHPSVPDERVICDDVCNLDAEFYAQLALDTPVDVLIGSPPCQGFSHVGSRSKNKGYRLEDDARNFLFEHLIEAAVALRPRLFLLENVPGMASAKKQSLSFLELATERLEAAGFRTKVWRLNAASYGVPQDRIRYFLVASSIGHLPSMPVEEYQDIQRSDYDIDGLPAITVDEAIFDLPPCEAGGGEVVSIWPEPRADADPRLKRYLRKFKIRSDRRLLFNHTVRYHNDRDLELYSILQPGEDSIHAIERHGRDDLMTYRIDVFDDKYAKLRPDRPSKTIVSHLAKDGNGYIHPTQVRSISLREAARLQSFPDSFVFCGSPSDQWVQVGNAVPPLLAQAIARSFIETLNKEYRS